MDDTETRRAYGRRGRRDDLENRTEYGFGHGGGTVVAAKVWRATRAIEFAGMTIVIFGGSRGLGLVMAREFGTEGARIVLVARDEDDSSERKPTSRTAESR